MSIADQVKNIIAEVLQLGARAQSMHAQTPLLGQIPEFDSMAVVSVITSLEQHFHITVEDDDINADTFATLASLTEFVSFKLLSLKTGNATWMD